MTTDLLSNQISVQVSMSVQLEQFVLSRDPPPNKPRARTTETHPGCHVCGASSVQACCFQTDKGAKTRVWKCGGDSGNTFTINVGEAADVCLNITSVCNRSDLRALIVNIDGDFLTTVAAVFHSSLLTFKD